jgi:hypothetical protein
MLRMCYTVSAYKIIKGLIITCCRECYVAVLWFLLLQKRIDLALYLVEDSLSNGDDNSFHTFVILHLKTKTPNTLVQYCSFFGYKITKLNIHDMNASIYIPAFFGSNLQLP